MSFYDDASLVFLPSGGAGKDGKAYSIKPRTGDGDFTFSRGSNLTATRVDSNGLIEKGRENLLLQSNQFDTTWALSSTSVTSGQGGYDGSSDAWLLNSTTTGFPRIAQNITSSGVATYSIYAKAATDGFILMRTFGADSTVWFDLTNGTIPNAAGSQYITSNIQSVGNGWYRCSVTFNGSLTSLRVYPASAYGVYSTSGNGVYIQDAQLEIGLAPTEPIESGASTGLAGILEDSPRFDYSGGASCPSLLLEPSRTNLIGYSEYFNDWDIKTNISFQVNEGISPEGLQNAQNIYPTSNGACFMYENVSYTSGETYVYSVFAKSNGKDYLQITTSGSSFGTDYCTFDLSNGTIDNNGFTNADIEDYGNGWYRCYIVVSAIATSSSRIVIGLVPSATSSRLEEITANGTDGVLIYGVFNEQGSYSSSYIPNHSGGSVTREEDTTAQLSLSSSYGSSNTWFFELKRITDTSLSNQSIAILKNDSTGASNRFTIYSTSGGRFRVLLSDENGTTENLFSPSDGFEKGETIKAAVKITSSGCTLFVDGSSVATSSSVGTITGIDTITYFKKAALKQFLIFPSALSDAECITLTS